MAITAINILSIEYIQETFKIEEIIFQPATGEQDLEIDENAKKEWEVAIARAHQWIDGNTNYRQEDGTLKALTEVQLHYLRQGTAGVAHTINNMGDDYTLGSLSISMGGTSISQTKTTITELPQQYRQLLVKAGVLSEEDFTSNIELCDSSEIDFEDDNPADSGDQVATENWVTAMFAKKAVASYNNGLTIKGGSREYDLDAIMDANNTANVKHTQETGGVVTSKSEHWKHERNINKNTEDNINTKLYITGVGADARVSSTEDQAIAPADDGSNVTETLRFDVSDIGVPIDPDDPTSVGNIDYDQNTITLATNTDITKVTEIQLDVDLLYIGQGDGTTTYSARVSVDHVGGDGTFKANYVLSDGFSWQSIDKDRLHSVKIVLADLIKQKVPIVAGDKFVAKIETLNGNGAKVRLNIFGIKDVSNLIAGSEASQIKYDNTKVPLGDNVQVALETAVLQNRFKSLFDLGLDPTYAKVLAEFDALTPDLMPIDKNGHVLSIKLTSGTFIGVVSEYNEATVVKMADGQERTGISMNLKGELHRANAGTISSIDFQRSFVFSLDTDPLVTRADTITVDTPTEDNHAVTKLYSDDRDLDVLEEAEAYTDVEVASAISGLMETVILPANTYSRSQLRTLLNNGNCFNMRWTSLESGTTISMILGISTSRILYYNVGQGDASDSTSLGQEIRYERIVGLGTLKEVTIKLNEEKKA